MKKILALLLAVTMILTMASCGGKKNTPEDSSPSQSTDQTKTEEKQPEAPVEEEPAVDLISHDFSRFGAGRVTISGAEFSTNEDGEDFLRIYYDYTNISDIGVTPVSCAAFVATQNGQELEEAYVNEGDPSYVEEDGAYEVTILPGLTSRHTALFACSPDDGVVDIGCYVMIGSWAYTEDRIEWLRFQVDPADLMGAPEKPLNFAPITEATHTVGRPTSGTSTSASAPFDLSLDGWELTTYDGESALRVSMTLTSHCDQEWPAQMLVPITAYQDGYSLPYAGTWYIDDPKDSDYAFEEDVEPEETVSCSAIYLLRNDNPVEIAVEAPMDDLRLGLACDVASAKKAAQEQAAQDQAAADAASAAAAAKLIGTWLQRDSDWEDTYIFHADGSGMLISGPEYPFTYALSGDTLTLTYDPDDEETFTITVEDNLLTMIDDWGDELLLDKQAGDVPETTEPTGTPEEAPADAEAAPPAALLGTWIDVENGINEGYTFNSDWTGMYFYEIDGRTEFTFTYEVDENNVADIHYDDGDYEYFDYFIEDDTYLWLRGSWRLTKQ